MDSARAGLLKRALVDCTLSRREPRQPTGVPCGSRRHDRSSDPAETLPPDHAPPCRGLGRGAAAYQILAQALPSPDSAP